MNLNLKIEKVYSKLPEYEANEAAVMQHTASRCNRHDYNFLIKSGHEHFFINDLRSAKLDSESALKLYQMNKKPPMAWCKFWPNIVKMKTAFAPKPNNVNIHGYAISPKKPAFNTAQTIFALY